MKALVIGGGLGGVSSALALRKAGVDAVVFERARDLSHVQVGGAYGLWYTGVRAVRELGLADGLAEIGGAIERFEFESGQGAPLSSANVGDRGRALGLPPVGVMRGDLHRLLAAELGETEIRFGSECTGFRDEGDAVVAEFSDGSEERGDFLVGADGARSRIRSLLFGRDSLRYPGYGHWSGFVDLEHELTPAGVFRIMYGGGARFAFLPVSPERLCWWCTFPAPQADGGARTGLKSMLLERFRGWAAPVEAVIETTPDEVMGRRDTLDRAPLERWGEGRVTLAGDAAHPMTFNLGQGAGSALKDGVMLARHLQLAGDVTTALRAYEAQRIPPTTRWLNKSRTIGLLASRSRGPASPVHNLILKWFPSLAVAELERDLDFEARSS